MERASEHQEDGDAVLEFEILHEICGGDADLERELLEQLLHSVPVTLTSIGTSLERGDGAQVHAGAHSLKGSCLTLGANALGRVCAEMELSARRGNLDAARQLLARADRELSRLQDLLAGYLHRT